MAPGRTAALLAAAVLLAACTPDSERSDAELYEKYCSKCHGEDGRGNESLKEGNEKVDLLVSGRIREGDRDFVWRRVAYGYDQMPAYIHELDPPDLERLVDFVMRIQQPPSEGDDHGPPAIQGDLPAAEGPG